MDARAILRAAVDAVNPVALVSSALTASPLLPSKPDVRVIAAGKAAWPMLQGALAVLDTRAVTGLATAADPGGEAPPGVEFIPGSHPLPDHNSVRAASHALQLAALARKDGGGLLVLLSGGGSAMLAAPADGLSLEDKRLTIASLLRAGADVAQLNCVRKHLSAVKGGRLSIAGGDVLTLAISDVHTPEDDPATIASGPTAADPTTFADALAVLNELRCDVPAAVRMHLERGASGRIDETPKPRDPRLDRSTFRVIGSRHTAMAGAALHAERLGYSVRVLEPPTRGEARDAGRTFGETALSTSPLAGPVCVIASGETTVRVRGDGRGGRNQEFALGAAAPLAATEGLALVASAGTDGVDGPTDAAGGISTSTTLGRLDALGLDLAEVLARNDAYSALERLGDLVRWGPTGTNVGDVHVALTMCR